MTKPQTYWWCLDHKAVEEGAGCSSSSRLGPYPTRDDAASAMDRVKARAEEMEAKERDEEEKGWN